MTLAWSIRFVPCIKVSLGISIIESEDIVLIYDVRKLCIIQTYDQSSKMFEIVLKGTGKFQRTPETAIFLENF